MNCTDISDLPGLAHMFVIRRPDRPLPAIKTGLKPILAWLAANPMVPLSWEVARDIAALADRHYAMPIFFKAMIRRVNPTRLRIVTAGEVHAALTGVPHVAPLPAGAVLYWSDGRLWNGCKWCRPSRFEAGMLARVA